MSRIPPDQLSDSGPPKGYRYEWVPEDRDHFTTDPAVIDGFGCRRMGRDYKTCGAPAVAAIARGVTKVWWRYCKDHLYGRRIRDGVVEYRRVVKVDE